MKFDLNLRWSVEVDRRGGASGWSGKVERQGGAAGVENPRRGGVAVVRILEILSLYVFPGESGFAP